jgi:hypothetical protein
MLADREMGMRTEKLARVKLLCFSYITNTVKGKGDERDRDQSAVF